MAANSKAIKQRIKSVKNTKKITKAMEMVAAAKMRKAVEATLSTRQYALLARELMTKLSEFEESNTTLLSIRPVKKVLLVVVSSNRGLCGSFNTNMYKKAQQFITHLPEYARQVKKDGEVIEPEEQVEVDVLGIGKKSAVFAKKQNKSLIAVFEHLKESPHFQDVLPICKMVIDSFKEATYDKVFVAYTEYKSSVVQIPTLRQLLPISKISIDAMLDMSGSKSTSEEISDELSLDRMIFEPDAETILRTILPRLLEVQLYQTVLESSASEYSARMVAMKNASDSAGDMIQQLSLEYNKNRQAAITREIAEIVGGAVALE